jgi:hypothetical protein
MGATDDPRFRSDLYRGTASYYDRFRVPYPPGMLADLVHRSGARGDGSLLDLGCGPGLVGFAYSTSMLSRAALGDLAAGFEQDLQRQVRATAPSGVLRQTMTSAHELARRPA